MVCMPSTMLRFAGEGTQKFACPQKHREHPESSTGSDSRQHSDQSGTAACNCSYLLSLYSLAKPDPSITCFTLGSGFARLLALWVHGGSTGLVGGGPVGGDTGHVDGGDVVGGDAGPRHMDGGDAGPRHMDGGDVSPRPVDGGDASPRPMDGGDASPRPMDGGDASPRPMDGGDASPRPMVGGDVSPRPMVGGDVHRVNTGVVAGGDLVGTCTPRPKAKRSLSYGTPQSTKKALSLKVQ